MERSSFSNLCKGRKGEKLAAIYLKRKGYKVASANWTCRWGELDLVCEKGDVLVFVEVKYRTSRTFGYPQESVSRHKMRKLRRAAEFYLVREKPKQQNYRFEVVAISQVKGKIRLSHYSAVVSE